MSKNISKEDFDKGAKALPQCQGQNQSNEPLKAVCPGDDLPDLPEPRVPEKIIYQALDENEDGDAALVVLLFKGLRLYDQRANPVAAWHYWNDHHWREDEQKHIFPLVNDVVGLYYEQRQREKWKIRKLNKDCKLSQVEREQEIDSLTQKIQALKARVISLQTLKRKTSVLRLASMGINSLGYVGDGWDRDPWLLGCKNGVIDLKKGICRPGQPEDYIKTICPVAWDDNSDCPTWKQILFEILDHDQELFDFMQRLFGYAITGLREEHIYPIFWGPHGRNGKGTIFETLKLILGPMAYRAPTQLVMQGLHSKSPGPNSALMKFRGARIVWTSEANKKDHIDTAIVKGLSGGDTITARNPFDRKETDFTPSHTIFTVVNPLPKVDADDDAFWDRAILFPFNLSFVDNPNPKRSWERQRNTKLEDTLKKELPGILKWLVQGTQEWVQHGLMIPRQLTEAKEKYRVSEDIIGNFLEESCYVEIDNMSIKAKPRDLYLKYKEWCVENGYKNLNKKHFNEAVKKKLGEQYKIEGVMYYKGIFIIDNM